MTRVSVARTRSAASARAGVSQRADDGLCRDQSGFPAKEVPGRAGKPITPFGCAAGGHPTATCMRITAVVWSPSRKSTSDQGICGVYLSPGNVPRDAADL